MDLYIQLDVKTIIVKIAYINLFKIIQIKQLFFSFTNIVIGSFKIKIYNIGKKYQWNKTTTYKKESRLYYSGAD